MPDIIHEFTVNALPEKVFPMFTTPEGLDRWWTKESSGKPDLGAEYRLYFGPEYDWRAKVTRLSHAREFELEMTSAHEDWLGTRVGCLLHPEQNGRTRVKFYHQGWLEPHEHWRVSCYCWAMYLRILRRNVEFGEFVPYEKRLDV